MSNIHNLQVSDNRRFLVHDDGNPFFYLADTAWCIFHRLTREEADHYLDTRASQGFTAIQAVLLAEHGGLEVPNAYGEREFRGGDIRKPNEAYFAHVDYVVRKAASLGLVVGLLPSWGDKVGVNYWGSGPAHFINEENARYWGEFAGERFGSCPVIWILGGDRPPDGNEEIWRQMAAGIKAKEERPHLMTYHPIGGFSSSHWVHHEEWLDFNMSQSGHGPFIPNYRFIGTDYQFSPVKPCLDGEPCYEDHPASFNQDSLYINDYHVRVAAYQAVFAGACGHTYGCHAMWQFWDPECRKPVNSPKLPWRDSLRIPGAEQMRHLRNLIASRPYLTRIPDQGLVRSGQVFRRGHVQVTRDGSRGAADASYVMVYFSAAQTIELDTTVIRGGDLRAWWFNPSDGSATDAGKLQADRNVSISTPQDNIGRDWILVVDDEAAGYSTPGRAGSTEK